MRFTVIGGLNPGVETRVEILHAGDLLQVEAGQALLSHAAKETFDFPAAFGLIGRGVDNQNPERGRDAGQLSRAVDLAIVDIEADRNASGGDGLAQAIEQGFQTFIGVKLRMGNQTGCIVENGVEHRLLFASARTGDVGTKHHVGLPDLVGKLRFKFLVRGRSQQLLLS